MISLLAIFFLFFLMFLIASATSRISFKMVDFLGTPSHLLIVWTSFGTEVFISSLFSATGRGPASVMEFRAINAKQTENKTSEGYFKRLKKFIVWNLVYSWNHERKHIIIYRVQLIKHPILQIPIFNFPNLRFLFLFSITRIREFGIFCETMRWAHNLSDFKISSSQFSRISNWFCWNKNETIKQLIVWRKFWFRNLVYPQNHEVSISFIRIPNFLTNRFVKIKIHLKKSEFGSIFVKPCGEHIIYQKFSKLTYLRQNTSWFEALLDKLSTSNWRQAKRQVSKFYTYLYNILLYYLRRSPAAMQNIFF